MYYTGFRLKRKLAKMHFGSKERVIPFFGSHPKVMMERILRLEGPPPTKKEDSVIVRGNFKGISQNILDSLECKNLQFIARNEKPPKNFKGRLVDLNPIGMVPKFFNRGIPDRMDAKNSPPWPADLYFVFKCSEQGLGFS